MSWEEQLSNGTEQKVFAALANPGWDFRTVEGIAEDTELPQQQVAEILQKHPDLVRKSYVPDAKGRVLYTLKERPVKIQERLAFLRALLAKSFR